jgi:FkbM family methyltransferase
VELAIDPSETIGRAVWTTGVYDIAVSELLYRLTPPGGVAVDAGANIGYMTGILAARAGAGGVVYAFEPHPKVADRLRENVARIGRLPGAARVEVRQLGLSDAAGLARLACPGEFADNQGLGFLTTDPGAGIDVETCRLDEVIGGGRIDVMKMDVEGHEAAVLRGGERLLARRGIRHLVFEEHRPEASEAIGLLRGAGYTLFQVGWRLAGPVLADPAAARVCKQYEAPSYLATTDPDGAVAACRPSGWRILG